MFNKNFYPTPDWVMDLMLEGESITGKNILEPHVGKADLVIRLQKEGAAEVIGCEIEPELKKIAQTYCRIIEDDFLKVTSDMISHVDMIIMNPPFDRADEHLTHAYEIAPDGCKIIAVCNSNTLENDYSRLRRELRSIIGRYGTSEEIGEVFAKSERSTKVNTSLIKIQKPGATYDREFEGFFIEEEKEESADPGLMPYNFIRDLVARYVESIKIFDQQMETAVKLNEMRGEFFGSGKPELAITITRLTVPVQRGDFKKELQKAGWDFIFKKMNMEKYATKGLEEDINKFVETQQNVPFTMRNIYKMLEIVVGTTGQRMDKALLEVFDNVTYHSHDNRYNLEGWKTNSHCLLTKKFIIGNVVGIGWSGQIARPSWSNDRFGMVEDLVKSLCYLTGKNYSTMVSLEDFITYKYFLVKDGEFLNDKNYDFDVKIKSNDADEKYDSINRSKESYYGSEIFERNIDWGTWFDWGFFRCKAYKKGTMHFEFKDEKVWVLFNQRVAKLKGYPLPEQKEQTAYQKRQTGRKDPVKAEKPRPQQPMTILSTIKIKK